MTNIDELEGRALAEAVALKLGWTYVSTTPGGHGYWEDSKGSYQFGGADYRPDRDIAQAWELDGEGWYWSDSETGLGDRYRVNARVVMRCPNEDGTRDRFEASALFADHDTKAAAYATARCRAFLKAKAESP